MQINDSSGGGGMVRANMSKEPVEAVGRVLVEEVMVISE